MNKAFKLLLFFLCAHTAVLFANEPEKQLRDDGELFKVAIAGYTFVNFNLDETLKMMQEVDVHYLCIKDFHLPLNSTDEEIAAFHAKLASYNVTGYAVGPIYMKTKEEVDKAFEYAKRVGVKLIVGVPNHDVLPYVDQKVKEYDFKYAIHLHGPDIDLYPHATDIYEHVKDLDPRIGMCLDIGHNMRAGHDPVADLKKYSERVFDIHMKNTTAASKEGKTGEIGRGIIDIPAFVRMLREVKYTGACSLEYERNMKAPLAGIAESIGYFRGVIDATK
ncbi:sugar phosphate isomerase/epimerase [Dysgonomonas sp. 521]|uniref:sugar phosphate isomerase/epimerase family protein n=1 Tax=Dysgonomonas sp. 521 TaxID=2302932 RepID=UPI0013D58C28|nr:sugar phosphate isomerase/epimerase family protein [Dysgonomonas sp. 521]NDV97051.1 sugar phosphate isomerase/epimerase [Dysgonomonas sp. 521]